MHNYPDHKIAIMSDNPLTDKGLKVIKSLENYDYDVLLVLGDIAYDLNDQYGNFGD